MLKLELKNNTFKKNKEDFFKIEDFGLNFLEYSAKDVI